MEDGAVNCQLSSGRRRVGRQKPVSCLYLNFQIRGADNGAIRENILDGPITAAPTGDAHLHGCHVKIKLVCSSIEQQSRSNLQVVVNRRRLTTNYAAVREDGADSSRRRGARDHCGCQARGSSIYLRANGCSVGPKLLNDKARSALSWELVARWRDCYLWGGRITAGYADDVAVSPYPGHALIDGTGSVDPFLQRSIIDFKGRSAVLCACCSDRIHRCDPHTTASKQFEATDALEASICSHRSNACAGRARPSYSALDDI